MHPFLKTDFHIRWSDLKPEHIVPDITKAMKEAQATVDSVASLHPPYTYEKTIEALDRGLEILDHAWGLVSHLDSVCNSPEFREAHNAMLPKVSEFYSAIPLNNELWEVLKAYGESDAIEALSPTKQRYIRETMADFREAGADLPADKKKRTAEIQSELAELTQKYSENCLDAMNAWEKLITDESLLSGLPESAIAAAKQDAERKGHKNTWRFTLQAPSYIPIMTYADNDALRKEFWQAYAAIGRESPHENRPLVQRILNLRHELAQVVGRENFADHATERRMVASGDAALHFTESIFEKVRHPFKAEGKQLRHFANKSKTGEKFDSHGPTSDLQNSAQALPLLEPWEAGYWAEKQRRTAYDFDEEELRPYFPINRVIEGMFDLTETLFGLKIVEFRNPNFEAISQIPDEPFKDQGSVSGAPQVWHQDVQYYNLYDAASQEHLGSFYADWYPREPKRGGAWMNYLITGTREEERSPHLGLICGNLTPSVGDKPALLNHREVETIFHEFGHLLHHLCGEVEVKALNGVNVAWDFVELPSQIMENWCWEQDSLDRFARHHESGEPIPEALFKKMLAARNYMKATANVRQLSFAKMDLELHINWPRTAGDDLDSFIEGVLADYSSDYATKAKSNVFNFSHLFSSPTGYAAGYYSYKWAEVLDADAFTRFQKEGILNPKTGREFRGKILAKGNSEDPGELYKNFMGRAPDPEALLRRDGLI